MALIVARVWKGVRFARSPGFRVFALLAQRYAPNDAAESARRCTYQPRHSGRRREAPESRKPGVARGVTQSRRKIEGAAMPARAPAVRF
jgi:hypothetical protein